MLADIEQGSLASKAATEIRNMLIEGHFGPGEKLSEVQVASQLGISRNTLREVFRILASQGLLIHVPNRGAFVAAPDEAAVIDIYRTRRVIQRGAVHAAALGHPALARMQALVADAGNMRDGGNWQAVGTLNMDFHRAMVELCDSSRLSACFDLVMAELRLVFGQLIDTGHLHEPYVELNASLYKLLLEGRTAEALSLLDHYLVQSERSVLAALHRRRSDQKAVT
ncbi:GntR family transcriptional regulator [Rhizobium sp. Root708]|uniref:GntR family transcriptional regulator n=1 Tax=Rhizobium sp. Root708 TaxID=1736592 RepID=UPI0006FE2195|nr:GntR family transcriptional regulator [Rhizobium sp. Root708]KRB60037.1 GntR family transcriptional regulator [Rhizobium sp. Root708]